MGPEGAERERQLVEVVRRAGMRMVGPNCMGVLNADPAVSMNRLYVVESTPSVTETCLRLDVPLVELCGASGMTAWPP